MEKLRIRSDLGTSEENLTLNLRKTFDQCSIRSFGSAVLDPQITRYTRRFSPQLCSDSRTSTLSSYTSDSRISNRKLPVTISAHPHFTPARYISERVVQLLSSAIIHPTHKPYYAPRRKIPFINPEEPSYGCQQCAQKYYCSVQSGLGLRLDIR